MQIGGLSMTPTHRLRRRRQTARQARRVLAALAVMSSLGTLSAPSRAEPRQATTDVRATRWKESFEQFAAADRARAPRPGGVLFVGSSSIRLWDNLEQDFQSLPIVTKRGFGGSRLSDCSDNVARLVLPYKPRLVIVYAGDNDLAEGATPAEVLESFQRFVAGVRAELPDTRIAYLSIKPSPLRASLIADARTANALIQAWSVSARNVDFIDIYSKMLGADGQPRADLFGPDRLHLNRAGYSLWRQEIAAHLETTLGAPAVPVAAR
jgi:lysophospholipase L1-like esterase